jgi:hypothetical protein
MALSWNEIKDRALRFSRNWADAHNESAEAKSFLDAFFDIFGVPRKKIATFEQRVQTLDHSDGYIDLLWKNVLLVEMKSKGKSLDKAFDQAKEYTQGLKEYELPKYILVCDFATFRLYDLEADTKMEFALHDLVQYIEHFGFIAGYQKHTFKEQDPVNIKAAELMGDLHDRLKAIGYTGHPLEVYLVRLLFCLFAEDTTIFQRQQFQDFITDYTAEDGSDLAARLHQLFEVLNIPPHKRLKNLSAELAEFPYVNGKLFEESLPTASFDSTMRTALLRACALDWSKISPAIFGAMFQAVMDSATRRNLGAHYTGEINILKVIKPLFLDEWWANFERVKAKKNLRHMQEFHRTLAGLTFLDPACGCGNFLVITYRELRLLEMDIIREIQRLSKRDTQSSLDISTLLLLDVDMMAGIEYEEFPAQIAQVAMWLIDHQMNMLASQEFGQYMVRLPLKKSARIVHGNALRMEWRELAKPNTTFSYILGNPPFVGKQYQTPAQKHDMEHVVGNIKGSGVLDYVTAWYIKAAQYIQGTQTKVGFVSTNSIAQGEQVGILWQELFHRYACKIHFAHRTFAWSNEARNNAAVHVVIIGFACFDIPEKRIFEYTDIKGEPHEIKASNINGYLINGHNINLLKRSKPLHLVPEMNYGSMPNDGGNLILDDTEKESLLATYLEMTPYVKKFVMGDELINNLSRWCLWLVHCPPELIRSIPQVKKKVDAVFEQRMSSSRKATQDLAKTPFLFGEIRQPISTYIALPRVSSEHRAYIPIAILSPDIIAGDKVYTIENATLYHFGILTSAMHNAWMRYTCGRLESRYSYSNTIVYNNFPWCTPTDKQKAMIERCAQAVLDARAEFPESSLADLYDPRSMPAVLTKAHHALDKAVESAYRAKPFASDSERVAYLFGLYEELTKGLFAPATKARRRS